MSSGLLPPAKLPPVFEHESTASTKKTILRFLRYLLFKSSAELNAFHSVAAPVPAFGYNGRFRPVR
jgi:hypothetical protein